MRLETAMAITQGQPFTDWRAATVKTVAEAKATGHDAGDVLRVMRTELDAMLRKLEPAAKATP